MKRVVLTLILILLLPFLVGCSYTGGNINVTSREDGSGTRGAFSELFGITEKLGDGTTVDLTMPEAEVTNSTAVVLQTVSEDENAIGYMSIGSLNDSVKALKIDGVEPTVKNVKDGSYKIMRPFILAVKQDHTGLVNDFLGFIQSGQGQELIEKEGYIAALKNAPNYTSSGESGKITVAGSSSVSPLMESLIQEYTKLNPDIDVELQQSDSTTGISTVGEGISDVGMSSRNLDNSEIDLGLEPVVIAYDGLAVIVNNQNRQDNLSRKEVFDIFTGKTTNWNQLSGGE